MSWLSRRRARKAFMRRLHVTELEKSNGLELSYPELDLPTIRVVRNPNGFYWEPWVAVGFPGEWNPTFENGYTGCSTTAGSRRACVAAARERLYQIALAKSEDPKEVQL